MHKFDHVNPSTSNCIVRAKTHRFRFDSRRGKNQQIGLRVQRFTGADKDILIFVAPSHTTATHITITQTSQPTAHLITNRRVVKNPQWGWGGCYGGLEAAKALYFFGKNYLTLGQF